MDALEKHHLKPNAVSLVVRDTQGRVKQVIKTHNLRTNAGADFQKNQMSGTAVAVANFIAVTQNATAPVASDTTLTGEETTNGLGRAAGTFNGGAAGSTSYTLSKTFTYTGSGSVNLNKAAVFNGASGSTMVFETLFGTPANLATGDQITVTWTVNI